MGVKKPKAVAKATKTWQQFIAEDTKGHIEEYLAKFPGQVVVPEIRRLVRITETNPSMRTIDRATLTDRIERMNKTFGQNLDTVTDVEIGKAWTNTTIQYYVENGVTKFVSIAELDGNTCIVCRHLHGKSIGSEGNPDLPFPQLEDVDNIPPEEVGAKGYRPPYHPGCRCIVAPLW